MVKAKLLFIFLCSIFLLSFISAEEFGYGRTMELPINYSLIPTVNNSVYWDGNAFDLFRWLNIDGSNANQNIDISPYNLSAGYFIGDGSQLTNLAINTTTFMFTNGSNAQPVLHFNNSDLYIGNINGTNATFENVNITKNSTLYIGGIALSTQDTFEGKRVLSIKDNETGDDVFVDAFAYLGSGFYLTNISFENGTVFAANFNATGQYIGGNFTGDNFTGTNAFFDFYDWTAQSPFLIFNGTFLSFNETALNNTIQNANFTSITLNGETITSWSEVNYTVSNNTVIATTPTFTGSYSMVLPEQFSFEIAQIIVTPINSGNYRFGMYEVSGETIDANLITHNGVWNIFKSYPIDNQVTINFTNVAPANNFTVTIKYFQNQPN